MPHPEADEVDEARLLYVAMTRSTELLFLTCHSTSIFADKLGQFEDQVAG